MVDDGGEVTRETDTIVSVWSEWEGWTMGEIVVLEMVAASSSNNDSA